MQRDVIRTWQPIVIATLILLGLIACDGSAVYTTCVDQVTPEIPGLVVKRHGPTPQGMILITNKTGDDLSLFHEGKEVIRISATGEIFILHRRNNVWENHGSQGQDGVVQYSYSPVSYYGPQPEKRGTVVSTWVVRGRVGDTPFEIHGRTVYKPRNGVCAP